MVITIERQYGSGGRLVGEKLAKLLGYQFYDRELLKIAARESGMSEDVVEHFDERPTNSLFLSSYLLSSYMMSDAMPLNQKLAFAQFDVIRKVAQSGDCVIVGRCADYVLQSRPDRLSVFIHASNEVRALRLVTYYGVPEAFVDKVIKREDKSRSEYYASFTQSKWSDLRHYDLVIDTGMFGLDGAAALIAQAVKIKGEAKPSE